MSFEENEGQTSKTNSTNTMQRSNTEKNNKNLGYALIIIGLITLILISKLLGILIVIIAIAYLNRDKLGLKSDADVAKYAGKRFVIIVATALIIIFVVLLLLFATGIFSTGTSKPNFSQRNIGAPSYIANMSFLAQYNYTNSSYYSSLSSLRYGPINATEFLYEQISKGTSSETVVNNTVQNSTYYPVTEMSIMLNVFRSPQAAVSAYDNYTNASKWNITAIFNKTPYSEEYEVTIPGNSIGNTLNYNFIQVNSTYLCISEIGVLQNKPTYTFAQLDLTLHGGNSLCLNSTKSFHKS